MYQYKIIDMHTHTYPPAISERACEALGRFYDFPIQGRGTYEDLEQEAKETGVCGFLLFSVATNAHQVPKVNDSIAALAEYSRSRGFTTFGFAGMHQDYPDFAGEIARCRTMGLRGVKIHPDIQGVNIEHTVEAQEVLNVKQMVEKKRPDLSHAIITYHLDKENINRYKPQTYEEIYHH